jgi:hypothetical protein
MAEQSLYDEAFTRWLTALEARHLADLRVPEVTRALRALSAAYIERRHRVRGTLDSAGKRAAFALFYAPLHFIAVSEVVRALSAATPPPASIIDLGCGTGVAGSAWALAAGGRPAILGLDRHRWAVEEARWTYRQLGVLGHARQADIIKVPRLREGAAITAGWVLNELSDDSRTRVEHQLIDAADCGARVLVLEPISRSVVPWWDATAARVTAAGGRADVWRFPIELPPMLQLFDRAAGLDHHELTVRTLFIGSTSARTR